MRIVRFYFLDEGVYLGRNGFQHLLVIVLELLAGLLLCLFEDSGDVLHIFQECHGESFAREFLIAVHSPITVLEIVVLH